MAGLCVLVSLDGWGIPPPWKGIPVPRAEPQTFNQLWQKYPHGQLIASGESVGLPANEVGNSEVGHLTMGVGRVIFQSLERINYAIRDETFFENQTLLKVVHRVKAQRSNLHLVGLVGSGRVHSAYNHLEALLELCKRTKLINLNIHVITDGRDSPPQEALQVISKLETSLKEAFGLGRIATVMG